MGVLFVGVWHRHWRAAAVFRVPQGPAGAWCAATPSRQAARYLTLPFPQTGEELAELREVDDAEHNPDPGLLDRAKIMVHESIQRFGFWAILLAASIPNPLFDLAGLTCGHFLIPFWTFFGATVIGKAVVKVHIQAFFYVAVFNVAAMDALENLMPAMLKHWVAVLKKTVLTSQFPICRDRGVQHGSVDACRECCGEFFAAHDTEHEIVPACAAFCSEEAKQGSWVAWAWNSVVTLVVLWFVLSIVHDTARRQLVSEAMADGPLAQPVAVVARGDDDAEEEEEEQDSEEDSEEEQEEEQGEDSAAGNDGDGQADDSEATDDSEDASGDDDGEEDYIASDDSDDGQAARPSGLRRRKRAVAASGPRVRGRSRSQSRPAVRTSTGRGRGRGRGRGQARTGGGAGAGAGASASNRRTSPSPVRRSSLRRLD